MRTVVVLAGGLGTRVAHLTGDDRPKALLPIAGRAFIDVKLAQLASIGAERVLVLVGHGADALEAHLHATSIRGLEVACRRDGSRPLGTGGAVRASLGRLPETFWITYGDTLVEAPLAHVEALCDDACAGVMTVLHNRDRWAPSNVDVEGDLVVRYEKDAGAGGLEWIDYGLLLIRRRVFDETSKGACFDLSEPLQAAVARRCLRAYEIDHRFHDIGTEEAWRETDRWARQTGLLDRLELR
jgi:NDP-sugar pyrophosphorylase family protein